MLLDLPEHLLLLVLRQLDPVSLCAAARACATLCRLAAHPSLWPAAADPHCSSWALGGIQHALGSILHLPPQVFQAQLGAGRSRRFPVVVPLHNLRAILATSDADGIADRASRALQERVARVSSNLWRYDTWQDFPPAASISVCRADGASIRAALRPQAVVPRLVQQLQQAGWPAQLPAALAPAATASSCSSDSTASAALMPGLLHVQQLCQHRLSLLRDQQIPQLQHLSGHRPASSNSSRGCHASRPNTAALHAAAAQLPDEDTAREVAGWVIASSTSYMQECSLHTATTAVRLFWASMHGANVASLTSARSSWTTLLKQAAKVVARLLTLQHSCGSELQQQGSSQQQAASWWQQAGQAELQLCLGLNELLVALPSCQPAPLCACLQALDTAAAEYLATSSGGSSGSLLAGLHAVHLGEEARSQRGQLRQVMLAEVVRAMQWCLWLLGVDVVDAVVSAGEPSAPDRGT